MLGPSFVEESFGDGDCSFGDISRRLHRLAESVEASLSSLASFSFISDSVLVVDPTSSVAVAVVLGERNDTRNGEDKSAERAEDLLERGHNIDSRSVTGDARHFGQRYGTRRAFS